MRLVDRAHELLAEALSEGDLAIDATAGNGHDVAFLAEQVGRSGMVYAFDLQKDAIEATAELLTEKALENVELHQCGHERMNERLPSESMGKFGAVTFNLGYLPGGDKSVITQTKTTRMALRLSLDLLSPGGLLVVVAYRGHSGGSEECNGVVEELSSLKENLSIEGDRAPDATSPLLLTARKA
jgi:predicted methyltransferase|tara:strand:- start:2908 stop:3459 length:552 start_codon:yes stop_codon:yes gene_type:complete